jgi:hypothetical protein
MLVTVGHQGCRVRQECLEFAMTHDQVYGIWGGTTPEDRQRDRRRKRRAATAAAKRAVPVLSRLSRRYPGPGSQGAERPVSFR